MDNSFKNRVNRERETFDVHEPPEHLWARIETGLAQAPVKKLTPLRVHLLRAAAAAAILAGIWLLVNGGAGSKNPKTEIARKPAETNQPVQPVVNTPELPNPVLAAEQPVKEPAKTANRQSYGPAQQTAGPVPENRLNENRRQYVANSLKREAPELHQRFSEDLETLQQQYKTLEARLKTNCNRNQVMEAMEQNLELQQELVNRQLNVIKQIKALKKPRNEYDTKKIT